MSKIKDCANLIASIMTYSDKNEQIKNESKLDSVLEAMLIFLDYEDIVEIINEKVVPCLLPKVYERWHDYIENKLEDYNDFI